MSNPEVQTPTPITNADTRSTPSNPHAIPPHIRIRNRRKRYLEAHPSYFGASLESADPLLYDRLIRSHQTEAERVQERSAKGFAGTLEADLLRSEAKLNEVKGRRTQSAGRQQHVSTPTTASTPSTASHKQQNSTNGTNGSSSTSTSVSGLTPLPTPSNNFSSLTRDEAHQYWIEHMTRRFLNGEDEDFEYGSVDDNEAWDDVRGEERDIEESWFDGEEEEFMGGSEGEGEGAGDGTSMPEGKGKRLVGETGVQDF